MSKKKTLVVPAFEGTPAECLRYLNSQVKRFRPARLDPKKVPGTVLIDFDREWTREGEHQWSGWYWWDTPLWDSAADLDLDATYDVSDWQLFYDGDDENLQESYSMGRDLVELLEEFLKAQSATNG